MLAIAVGGRVLGLALGGVAGLALSAPASAVAATIDFEQPAAGTVITNQYADFGGARQGVVFGPLPGGAGDGLRPVLQSAPGQAHSGSQVANIATCNGCEFFTPNTTGTFALPRSHISVAVGYLGANAFCSPQAVRDSPRAGQRRQPPGGGATGALRRNRTGRDANE